MANSPPKSIGAASPNFGHLAGIEPLLAEHGARAEGYVFTDPVVALIKLRQFGEVLAQQTAAHTGQYTSSNESQLDLLRRLRLDREVADVFHSIRRAGNLAAHENRGTKTDALHQLRLARRLGIWFQRAFKNRNFKAGPFIPPPNPEAIDKALAEELNELRATHAKHEAELAAAQLTADNESQLRAEAEAKAAAAYEDLGAALELVEDTQAEADARQARLESQLAEVQAKVAAAPPPEHEAINAQLQLASDNLDLDESETRLLIDQQLRDAGWEADSVALSYRAGVRPTKGKNLAIAEWQTSSGPADYVLFAGLTPVAVVEAKRAAKDVSGAIEQSKRYSRDYVVPSDQKSPGGPWGDYKVPFLFATNGRPYLRQLRTKSGVWFLDARRPTNTSNALDTWYTPDGLLALLAQDIEKADQRLENESPDYLPLRDYQLDAINAIERGITSGTRDMLLAMATGTGKTRTALCLIYRLIKAGRFRRILFLVDRTSLGEQAHNAFKDVRLENLQALTEIYDVRGLGDLKPERDTRLHVATIQGMVKRVLYTDDAPVPVDWYDCIVVDEYHRGYTLDRDMSDAEIEFRSEADYISKYRRVLEHFDAVRIGLTATPALHTTQIFGEPIYEYGYRRAVIDGNLVDHEPPYQIKTKLNVNGIKWAVGEEVSVYKKGSGQLQMFETPDEINIDVDGFNTAVITEPFNRVVCDWLAGEIDPSLPGKTMVFCATDNHADLVVDLLKASFTKVYGAIEDDAVQKITGASDKPLQKIRHYKNERHPNVAVTVDLLTTGIDVPQITNLVFIRRVKSRILYEQMMGRATRLCPDIDKSFFRIYDAVDLYSALLPYSAMQPVVTRPKISFEQLVSELSTVAEEHKPEVLEQIVAKLQITKRRLKGENLEAFKTLAGADPKAIIGQLKAMAPPAAMGFFADHPELSKFLDTFKSGGGKGVFVSEHEDEVVSVERGYGTGTKPEDYLAGFRDYIEQNKNAVDALMIVLQRPRDLTRQQLRELKLKLDQAGYSETALRTAQSELTNQDIAASIIGLIRQQALGSPLVPYDQRVDQALQRIRRQQTWSTAQKKWLERIGKQLKVETIVDRDALDRGRFKAEGGFNRLNKIFGGKLEAVLAELHEAVWKDAGSA